MGCGLDVLTAEVGGEEGGWRWGWGAAWTSSPRLGVRRVVGGGDGVRPGRPHGRGWR